MAEKLLQISAIKLQPENPFVWGSGWNSPIYNDNRRALSYPDIRNFIKVEMARVILENFDDAEAIASISVGAIPFGAIVADALGLPFVFLRSEPKDHGLENQIEGNLKPGQKVVLVEDMVSTGGSGMKAIETIHNAGCEIVGMTAMFTYEFPLAVKRFRDANLNFIALTSYSAMLQAALETEYLQPEDLEALHEWRKDPSTWVPKNMDN